MEELLEVFDLNGESLGIVERKQFYKDIQEAYEKHGKISRRVKTVRILLLNSEGKVFLQKRNKRKSQNPGMYDKTIGGHVHAGHTWFLTVVKECYEELGFPAVILSEKEFFDAIHTIDTSIIGAFRQVDITQIESVRKTKTGKFVQPQITATYIGYYDGGIRFKDAESVGIECFTMEELDEELADHPDKFTQDVRYMVEQYKKYLIPRKELPKSMKY